MPRRRKLDKHILKLLDDYRGVLLYYTEIREELEARGIKHTDASLTQNLQFLRKENRVWYFMSYGLPAMSSDGLWFVLDYDGHLFISPTEDISDIVQEFRIHVEKYFKTDEELRKAIIPARDNFVKNGFPKNITDELVLVSGWALENVMRFYPWIGMAKTVIEKGFMTVEQCAEAMNIPLESLEDTIKDFCDAKTFEDVNKKTKKTVVGRNENDKNKSGC